MKSKPTAIFILVCIFTLAAPAYFVVQTMLADQLSAASMSAIVAVFACVLVGVVFGLPRAAELKSLGRPDVLRIVIAGVGLFLSQYLVLANRYSDAPPGSEVLFFTTAGWGVLAVLGAFWTRRRPTVAQLVATGMALAGVAAILANWERPSSFSPFVRYPLEHLGMLAGGVGWVVFGLLVANLGRRMRLRAVLPPVAACAAVLGVLVALASPGRLEVLDLPSALWVQLLVVSCTFAAMLISWSWLATSTGVAESASLLFLPAVTLTLFGVFERRVSSAGPSPLLWDAVLWGSLVTVASAVGVAMLGRPAPADLAAATDSVNAPAGLSRWLVVASAIASAVACVSAALALYAPALRASVRGLNSGGAAYSASWALPGAETPAAWIAFLAALLTLVASMTFFSGTLRPAKALIASLVAGVGVASVPTLLSTPLRYWTRWIPAEVQQDYGTEYARLSFERVHRLPTSPTLVLIGVGVVLLVAGALMLGRLTGVTNGQSKKRSTTEPDGIT